MTPLEKHKINERLTTTLIDYYHLSNVDQYHTIMYKHFINLSIKNDVGGLVISEDTFKGLLRVLLKKC